MKILVTIAILAILVATNPSRAKHQERVFAVVSEQASREMGDGVGGAFGQLIGAHKVAGAFVADKLEYVNLFVCSLGRLDGEVVTIGALNCVVLKD